MAHDDFGRIHIHFHIFYKHFLS